MFGPSSSLYKGSHSGTESAVVLQCLMPLAAFPTPLGRDFSDFFTPLGRDFSNFFFTLLATVAITPNRNNEGLMVRVFKQSWVIIYANF